VRVKHTGYAVPDWGSGDLWTSDDAVLAHEFSFGEAALAAPAGARPADLGPLRTPPEDRRAAPSSIAVATRSPAALGSRIAVSHSRRTQPRAGLRLSPVAPEELVRRFAAFLTGADVDFADVPLDLDDLTPFQVAVTRSLRGIPRGTVVSYAELAALAGYPRAQRAVGTFCARNRFAFLLPCHRVVGAGGIGGYGSAGVGVKRRLLLLEGVEL
jgi:methylated-DNA-[protein]-cysteine S-methyltransferase